MNIQAELDKMLAAVKHPFAVVSVEITRTHNGTLEHRFAVFCGERKAYGYGPTAEAAIADIPSVQKQIDRLKADLAALEANR